MAEKPVIVLFRQDFRTEDNAALNAAAESGSPVIPLYVYSPQEEGSWAPGSASKWWMHHSLLCLKNDLKEFGLKLIIRKGPSLQVIEEIVKATGAKALFWNRRYEPAAICHEAALKKSLQRDRIQEQSFSGHLLYETWNIATRQNTPYQIFTPFWNCCLAHGSPLLPKPLPQTIHAYLGNQKTLEVEDLDLLPHVHWDAAFPAEWQPGEKNAKKMLQSFLNGPIKTYHETRNRPDLQGVSRLSPYLHFGEITPRTIWHEVCKMFGGYESAMEDLGASHFLRQIGWREFANHLLVHFPATPEHPLRKGFAAFPWEFDEEKLQLWQKGLTGYPIVDAGMRQLWKIGWMHNRLRMVVGSFLVKDLLIPWQEGAKWFWDTLVDADLANNTFGWQWVAGCGADAAPYFRIFNPIHQGKKFDPDGCYIRRYVPELAKLPNRWIHEPWRAPEAVLDKAGVILGKTYPMPIVDHAEARQKALQAFSLVKKLFNP